MILGRIVFLQIILHYTLVSALIRSTFLDDIPKNERKKYEEIKNTEFKHDISILSTDAKEALISSLSVKQSLEKNVEIALDKFNINNKLVDKIVERIESLANLIGEENGMSFDDFIDKIGSKLEQFDTYGFNFIKNSFEEIKTEVEETNYTSKTKVFYFFYLWIWNLIEFLDKIEYLDKDIDKRMSFVEKHDIFAILPGYISEMTFADWLQNNVIRVLELKFYPHIKLNDFNQAKYIIKTSVINLLPVANKKATSYIEVLQLDKIFKFNNKNSNFEQKEIILIFASVMLISKNISLNYTEKFKVFELFEKEFLNFVSISEYLKEEYERILEILKEYFIEKVQIDSKQLEIKVINFYIKVFEKYELLDWVKVLIDELNNEVTSLKSTGKGRRRSKIVKEEDLYTEDPFWEFIEVNGY